MLQNGKLSIREQYGDRAPALIVELREGYQGKEADRDELQDFIEEVLFNAPAVERYEAEQAYVYPIDIYGVKGAYFVWALDYPSVGWFTSLADARRYVTSNFGEFLL
jgi:hypothetical protein